MSALLKKSPVHDVPIDSKGKRSLKKSIS